MVTRESHVDRGRVDDVRITTRRGGASGTDEKLGVNYCLRLGLIGANEAKAGYKRQQYRPSVYAGLQHFLSPCQSILDLDLRLYAHKTNGFPLRLGTPRSRVGSFFNGVSVVETLPDSRAVPRPRKEHFDNLALRTSQELFHDLIIFMFFTVTVPISTRSTA